MNESIQSGTYNSIGICNCEVEKFSKLDQGDCSAELL